MLRRKGWKNQGQPFLLILNMAITSVSSSSLVAVRYKEGLTHGLLVLSTLDGTRMAEGDLTEVVHGNQITNRLVSHFKDSSLQDEITILTQRTKFFTDLLPPDPQRPDLRAPNRVVSRDFYRTGQRSLDRRQRKRKVRE